MDRHDTARQASEWKAIYERSERLRRHARVHFGMAMLVVAFNLASLVVPKPWHSYVVLGGLVTCVVLLVSAIRDMSGVLYGYRTERWMPDMIGPAKATIMQIAVTVFLLAFIALTIRTGAWPATK